MRDQITTAIEKHTATLRQANAKLADIDRQRTETIAMIQRLEGARHALAEVLLTLPSDEKPATPSGESSAEA